MEVNRAHSAAPCQLRLSHVCFDIKGVDQFLYGFIVEVTAVFRKKAVEVSCLHELLLEIVSFFNIVRISHLSNL